MIRKLQDTLLPGRGDAQAEAAAMAEKSARLLALARVAPEAALAKLHAKARGLTPEEADDRRIAHGRNVIAEEKPTPWPLQLLKSGHNPFNYLLLVLGGVSYATGDLRAAVVMGVMISVSVLLRFVQEYRSSQAAAQLKAMVSSTATVLRRACVTEGPEGEETLIEFSEAEELPLDQLVPGDVVRLAAGDMIPADLRILTAKDLFVSQAALTGESLPVEKADRLPEDLTEESDPLHLPTLCFMGSTVASGSATALVVSTGARTYLGSLAKDLVGQRAVTSFDKGVSRISWLLIRFMGVMVPVVFILNGATKHDWKDAFLFAISVAVGLTPEMLPMIVTSNLAKGALAMARRKVVVKQLSAIQNFGAMDILCTDKTGTLTQDEVYLERHIDLDGQESHTVIQHAYLNSFYQTGLKNQLDRAVLKHADLHDDMALDRSYRKVDEIPFDFDRRRMSVVVDKEGLGHVLVCKGAVEELLKICTRVEHGSAADWITEPVRERAKELVKRYNADGFRVVAVASRVMESKADYGVADEQDLTLLGFLAFLDPPKESAGQAIQALRDCGVAVKILTGDNATVTRKVCKEVGLPVDRIVLGAEIDALDPGELGALAEEVAVFAKLNPMQKSRIIQALRAKGHTVGYMGDGINDAGALREADIGISVDTAVDIAKESADIILLEKSLMVLEEGIVEGRKIFANIQKYLKMTASSNFGNTFSVLGASALLPFLPMLPIQLLVNNLLYDFSQIAIPWDRVDEDYLKVPRKWDSSDLTRFMVWIGPLSSVFDYATFGLMWWVFKANTDAHQGLFQSGWFIESLLSQTLIVHLLRTSKVPFIQSRAAAPLLLSTLGLMAIGMVIPYTGFGRAVGMVHLPLAYFGWLALILLAYCTLVQLVKTWYIRRFGAWL